MLQLDGNHAGIAGGGDVDGDVGVFQERELLLKQEVIAVIHPVTIIEIVLTKSWLL